MQSKSIVGESFDKREQLFEVSVFLFLIVPSLVYSFFLIKQGNVSFMLTAVATILRDLALVSLILFFLWRNGESILRIGWTLTGMRQEIIVGILLFVPMFVGAMMLDNILSSIGFSNPSTPLPSFEPGRNALAILVSIVLVAVVAVAEETCFRGYLILRFEAVTGSTLLSLLLSAFVFSLGHGYEGTAGVLTVGAIGVVLGLVYIWRKSLIAPVTMHFLQDFASIVLLPFIEK